MSRQDLYLARAVSHDNLYAELRHRLPDAALERRGLNLVAVEAAAAASHRPLVVAYAQQVIPGAESVAAESVSGWRDLLAARLRDSLVAHPGPWRLHVYGVDEHGVTTPRRATLIDSELTALFKKKQRGLLRQRNPEPTAPWAADEAVAQLLLMSPTSGVFSFASAAERSRHRAVLSPYPGGYLDVGEDKEAPSRAFQKVLEAEAHFGRRIEALERCVDLGAAPGGWTYVAVQRGAQVVAVDRGELEPRLARSPLVTMLAGDAFQYSPESTVDWLLCDVIAFPDKLAALLERWVEQRLCRRFIVTLKLKGAPPLTLLSALSDRLQDQGVELMMRQLLVNKNEVTVIGELPR